MKASVFIAVSLDGFIAREDGGIDWLGGPEEDCDDYGYMNFIESVDALVMGRATFEKALSFGEWPYGEKPVIVLSSRGVEIPEGIRGSVECLGGPPEEVVRTLSQRGFGHLYIDGGRTIQGFLNRGLIQRMIITRLPVLIGTGIPLFGPLSKDIKLRHLATRTFPNGFVQSEYEVAG